MGKNKKNYYLINGLFFFIFIFHGGAIHPKEGFHGVGYHINISKELKSKKRNDQVTISKSETKEINNFVKKSSEKISRKGKYNLNVKKSLDTGIIAKDMVKKNRWFVKKPFQKSYNKISKIKRVKPQKFKTNDGKKTSLKASVLTRNRARETGKIKPKEIFFEDSTREAKFISKSQTIAAGPPKSGPVYTEESSRLVMNISKTRSKDKGSVKPQEIFPDRIGRDAFKIISRKNKKKVSNKKTISTPRYSIEFLRSLSRRPNLKKNL